ncbi:MAG: peptidase C25 [Candidatus Thermoplasmatota archaeon]|nr:peptidase C25 [Candidatus Thermoplasmatota archaeon]MBU1940951.1 peptidase C25 [Candidatus Thermoplasmatota archaeon]
MKKTISIIVVGFLILSGLGAVALPANTSNQPLIETENLHLSAPQLSKSATYTSIHLQEATRMSLRSGEPNLPVITKVYAYPFGTQINGVDVTFSEPEEYIITNPIQPAPEAIPLLDIPSIYIITQDQTIYESTAFYPKERYTYSVHVGLDQNTHTTFVSVKCYPIQYSPATNTLRFSSDIDITIRTTEPKEPMIFGDSYDLAILAPQAFAGALQSLVDHKISHGIQTTLVTLETILNDYTGRDDAEKVKYFIKDAVEDWGITYVLIVGGLDGQKYNWLFPVRYTNNLAGDPYETGVLSDLYFSDIYKSDGNITEFEDWDANGNDIFAEFKPTSKDIMDLVPDVYVGRLSCRTLDQVTSNVEKIITYEDTKADPSWFNNMLLIAGDTYQDSPGGICEGEISTEYSSTFMAGFTFTRLWASNGQLTGQTSVEDAINDGAGFIHMAGHANPSILVTHPPQNNSKITILQMYHLKWLDFVGYVSKGKIDKAIEAIKKPRNPRLSNDGKLPVVIIGGCHNSQYNTTLMNIVTMKPFFTHAYGWGLYVPKCFSWYLTNLEKGGAIATMGNTGLGMGYHDEAYISGLDGWLLPQFFKHYGVNNEEYLGAPHSLAIRDYALTYDCNTDREDRQMIEQWALLGDPSMLIGGYE